MIQSHSGALKWGNIENMQDFGPEGLGIPITALDRVEQCVFGAWARSKRHIWVVKSLFSLRAADDSRHFHYFQYLVSWEAKFAALIETFNISLVFTFYQLSLFNQSNGIKSIIFSVTKYYHTKKLFSISGFCKSILNIKVQMTTWWRLVSHRLSTTCLVLSCGCMLAWASGYMF